MGSSGTRTWVFSGSRSCQGFMPDDTACCFEGDVDLEADPETGLAVWECDICGCLNEEEL